MTTSAAYETIDTDVLVLGAGRAGLVMRGNQGSLSSGRFATLLSLLRWRRDIWWLQSRSVAVGQSPTALATSVR
jgi:hypothetical protein